MSNSMKYLNHVLNEAVEGSDVNSGAFEYPSVYKEGIEDILRSVIQGSIDPRIKIGRVTRRVSDASGYVFEITGPVGVVRQYFDVKYDPYGWGFSRYTRKDRTQGDSAKFWIPKEGLKEKIEDALESGLFSDEELNPEPKFDPKLLDDVYSVEYGIRGTRLVGEWLVKAKSKQEARQAVIDYYSKIGDRTWGVKATPASTTHEEMDYDEKDIPTRYGQMEQIVTGT